MREETHCHHHMGYSFQLATRDLLCVPSCLLKHIYVSTYYQVSDTPAHVTALGMACDSVCGRCVPSHKQNGTYYGVCYTSHGALAKTRNSSMDPPWGIDTTTYHTMSRCYHKATSHSSLIQQMQTKYVILQLCNLAIFILRTMLTTMKLCALFMKA